MRKYHEQNNHWKESKALGFFLNFIKNHKGTVNDNDTFGLVASLRTHGQWIDLISEAFSEEKITLHGRLVPRSFADQPDDLFILRARIHLSHMLKNSVPRFVGFLGICFRYFLIPPDRLRREQD